MPFDAPCERTPGSATARQIALRMFCLLILSALLATQPALAQGTEGISSTLLSRCAGKAGGDIRQGDPAFVTIGLDGRPWMTIERSQDAVGVQPISTTVTGTGWRRRRDGTTVFYRFTCALDERGQAVLFHASALLHDLGDRLPPAVVVDGAAAYPDKTPLPRGVELQVQLIDPARPREARVVAEQVVRSGWHVPVPFSLRLPRDAPIADRTLVLSARMVLARQTLFELAEPLLVTVPDLARFLALSLARPRADR